MFNRYARTALQSCGNPVRSSVLNGQPYRLVRAADLAVDSGAPAADGQTGTRRQTGIWAPAELAGRLCELCATPRQVHLTLACAIVREFQRSAEPTAWVTASPDLFFPPDLARAGVDLAALPVVQVPDLRASVTAAERLTRSGAFGLVLLELDAGRFIPTAVLGRLMRLARQHDTALLFLTTPGTELGSLVSLRGRGARRATPRHDRFRCRIDVIKDRRRGPDRSLETTYRAPYGVC